ncbi:ZYRO0E05192p [Zygosaccharomyces rouxii]|uniref:ZYRO0E05192p n=1 Tax=Zygosaccharomyces rouxii (strain ATCC 2623 / CBS 732 / NBRC 1130 / NCYC 568 / NRRL Y-229) TaxID=559307 RepID=C5E4E1_ZYGRC|nr:uncharacterized protein ZYRO0E05192g [Zygosaccharomyces rouxii]KAH9198240.1 SNF2 family N-terminal domain-containing protein [Zygosaccharomyces rouxii]CAR30902.1 ZYRO0E05192p [Zygosaccharomyces rouxii]
MSSVATLDVAADQDFIGDGSKSRDSGTRCFVADGLSDYVCSSQITQPEKEGGIKETIKDGNKKSKLSKCQVEIARLRMYASGEVGGSTDLAAERRVLVQFLEMVDQDVLMVSGESGEKLLKVQRGIKDDRWRQILRVAHNKCLEWEVNNSKQNMEAFTTDTSRKSRKRGNRSTARNAVVMAKRLVSKMYKDLSCEVTIGLDSANRWILCIRVWLSYLPQSLNKFSTETKSFLDTWFSQRAAPSSPSSLDPLPPSPFIQGKFVSQTVAHTRQRLSRWYSDPVRDVPGLNLHLLPFQSSTVEWMLSKEVGEFLPRYLGKTKQELLQFLNGCVSYGYESISQDLFWNKFTNFVLTGEEVEQIYSGMWAKREEFNQRARGILCEEMGLGKTIEILSLILLNQRNLSDIPRTFIAEDGKTILRTSTTLIICPNAILQQWINEVESHTNDMSIFHYKGFLPVKKFFKTDNIWEIVDQLSHYDIVITSYNVVSTEVHYAEYNASSRPRRSTCPIKYDYSSPLSLMQFFRIILDEVQMLHSDSTKAAKCTSLLHRVHTWGVSGTPIQLVKDFQTVLSYLKISPFHELPEIISSVNNNVIQRQKEQLVQGVKFTLSELLNIPIEQDLTVRHSREDVISQIHIPRQHNYIVPLEFAPVEWDNYLDVWNSFVTVSGYGPNGTDSPRLNTIQLNQWLTRLRYLCCHAVFPDSHTNSKGQSHSSNASLHNIDDILKLMTTDAIEKLDSLYRDNYQLQIRSAQAKSELQNNPDGAIDLLHSVQEKLSEDLKEKCLVDDPFDTDGIPVEERSGTPATKDSPEGVSSIRTRAYLDLLHQCFFLMATAYYNKGSSRLEYVDDENEKLALKQSDEKPKTYTDVYNVEEMKDIEKNQRLEQEYYGYAERLRKRILFGRVQKVDIFVKETQDYFENDSSSRPQSLQYIEFSSSNNFANSMLVSRCFQLLSLLINSLNEQALQFNQLFGELAQLVYEPIIRDYDETNEDEKAQEYSNSIENQDKMFAILACMEQLLENRNSILTSDETIKLSKKTFKPQAGQKISDYHSELLSNLKLISGTPFKPIFDDLKNAKVVRNVSTSKSSHKSTSPQEFEDYLLRYEEEIPRMVREDKCIRDSLKKLNIVYNAKLEYYSHLQRISDSLVPLLQLENVTRNAIVKSIRDDTQYRRNLEKISSAESRVKYLNGLNKLKESIKHNQSFSCAICLGTIHTGSIIKCGHFFCRKCIHSWLKNNQSCPLCKTRATLLEVYNFKFKEEPEEESPPSSSSSSEKKNDSQNTNGNDNKQFKREHLDPVLKQKYEFFPQFEEVHKMVIKESFGAKIDFVIKLILFLKLKSESESDQEDPPQILMYSQSFEFLKVISKVLNIYEIKHLSCWANVTNVGEAISKFKRNTSITCLLLNVKSLGAGLNLLNARHVFLLDPIINRGDELQAMSRNNRIGQTKETYVWNFMIKNSVEENIFKYKCVLEGRRRLLGEKLKVKQENLDTMTVEEEEREELEMNESTGEQVCGKHLKNCFFPCTS